jgi:hypothetical protein
MPKDPKRNIQSYQIQGGHLNEFEFQKSQSEMAEESELPFSDETNKPDLAQATKRIAEVTAEAHRIVEKRKKRGDAKAGTGQRVAAAHRPAKKVAHKSAKKVAKKLPRKPATKFGRNKTTQVGTKKRAGVKRRSQKPRP